MAADLHIHVATPEALEDIRQYIQRDVWSSTLGNARTECLIEGAWIPIAEMTEEQWGQIEDRRYIPLQYDQGRVERTPNCWIGALGMSGPAVTIQQRIGPGIVELTPRLTAAVLEALTQPNKGGLRLVHRRRAERFLKKHRGSQIFTIAW